MRNTRCRNDGQEHPAVLRTLLDPLTWCCSRDWIWRHAPRWLDALCQMYLTWYIGQTLVVRMQQAELRGVDCTEIWMPPGAETAAVTQWFEQQVLKGPRAEIAASMTGRPWDGITFLLTPIWLGSGRDGAAAGGTTGPPSLPPLFPSTIAAATCAPSA